MAWNPSPEVAAARDFAKKFGYSRVVIKSLCASARRIGDWLWTPFRNALVAEQVRPHSTHGRRG